MTNSRAGGRRSADNDRPSPSQRKEEAEARSGAVRPQGAPGNPAYARLLQLGTAAAFGSSGAGSPSGDTADRAPPATPRATPSDSPPDANPPAPANPPTPSDPDAVCMQCNPITKITKKWKGTTYVFGLCSDQFQVFNTGAGSAMAEPGCLPRQSNKAGLVTFRAGLPAWQTKADLHDCTYAPNGATAATPWIFGFIQTVESANYGANYDNGRGVSITLNQSARDALTNTVPAPWYGDSKSGFGPQEYPTFPLLTDSPWAQFPITHPNSASDFLRAVCMRGRFNIWLILHRKGTTPTQSNVDFFYHWSINMNHSYKLAAGAHPCNHSQWSAAGSLSMSKGPGKGAATPVWDTPIAADSKATNNAPASPPCAVGDQAQDKPQSATKAPALEPKENG